MYRSLGNTSSKIISVSSSRVVAESEAADWLLDYAATHVNDGDHVHWEDVCGMAQAMIMTTDNNDKATALAQTQQLAEIKEQRQSRGASMEAGAAATGTSENSWPEDLDDDSKNKSSEAKKEKKEAKKRKKEEKKAKKEAKRAKKEAKKKKKEANQVD